MARSVVVQQLLKSSTVTSIFADLRKLMMKHSEGLLPHVIRIRPASWLALHHEVVGRSVVDGRSVFFSAHEIVENDTLVGASQPGLLLLLSQDRQAGHVATVGEISHASQTAKIAIKILLFI